jgi:hypothetical protein
VTQQRLLALSGIGFVALAVVAVVAIGGDTPATDASASALASFYDDNGVRQGVGAFVLAAAALFVVLFGVGLATRFAERGHSPTVWGHVLIAGTILVAGATLVSAFAHFALANGADENISPVALQALNTLDGNTWMAFNPAFGVMMVGAAGTLLTAGVMRPLAWIALVLGVAAFIPFADFFALLATLLWIVVAAVVLARSEPERGYVVTAEAA